MKRRNATVKMKNKKKIAKDMTFMELLKENPKAAELLAEKGMFCGGCPMAMMETLEQGALAHGFNADEIVKEIEKLSEVEVKKKSKK